jgi:hypothetical protein
MIFLLKKVHGIKICLQTIGIKLIVDQEYICGILENSVIQHLSRTLTPKKRGVLRTGDRKLSFPNFPTLPSKYDGLLFICF